MKITFRYQDSTHLNITSMSLIGSFNNYDMQKGKMEEVHLVKYFDYDVARFAIFEYIESWYNRKRIHSSIGYLTPQKCEDLARKIA